MNIFWTLYIFSTHRSWAVTGSRRRWWSRTTADFSFARGGCRGRSLCCGWWCRGGSRSSSCCGTATCKGCTAITTTCSWSVNTNIDKLHKFMEMRASLTLFAKCIKHQKNWPYCFSRRKLNKYFIFQYLIHLAQAIRSLWHFQTICQVMPPDVGTDKASVSFLVDII